MFFILLPAFNEESNIQLLLKTIVEETQNWAQADAHLSETDMTEVYSLIHVVMVNDGSSDATSTKARSFEGPIQVTVIDHETNQGLSAALFSGITFILERCSKDDFIFTLDADCTHHPRYIFQLLEKLKEGYDIVVASRYAPGGKEVGVNFFRRILSHGARRCYQFLFPNLPIRDFSCGFRGVRAKILQRTYEHWSEQLFESPGFACTGELMLKMLPHTNQERITEIPFELHYEEKSGTSKMPALKTILGTLSIILRARKWSPK